MDNNYNDIINLPAYSVKHPRISQQDRAAQFAPFAALTGFGAVINETSRLTDRKPELDAQTSRLLNERIRIIEENIKQKPKIEITFFVPDKRKSGGSLQSYRGNIRRIDKFERKFIFTDKTKISMDDIIFIQSELFKNIAPEESI